VLVELLVAGDGSVVRELEVVVDESSARAAPHTDAVHTIASITFFMELLLACLDDAKRSVVLLRQYSMR
jgi:hypothetical protein